jgi:isocitrate/isopropylmalate dehydrogenase
VHKANVLKALTGIFLETARDVAKSYEGRVAVRRPHRRRMRDAARAQPWQFDMIVTTNLFGDILSDEIAGLVGGSAWLPGGNIGEGAAIFEAVHGLGAGHRRQGHLQSDGAPARAGDDARSRRQDERRHEAAHGDRPVA